MTVKQLREALNNYPDHLPILTNKTEPDDGLNLEPTIDKVNYVRQEYFKDYILWPDWLIKNQPHREYFPGVLIQ